MKPRWRKIFADLWGNLARFVLVTLSLVVGLFAVGMIVGGYVTTLEDMQTGFRAINPAEIRVITDPFDENLVERIRRLDGVTQAEGERLLQLQFQSAGGEWKNLVIRVLPDNGRDINQVELLEGCMPEDRELLIDIHQQIEHSVGDMVTIQTPAGLEREMHLAGKVRDQTIGVFGTSYFVAPTHGYITFDTLPWLQQDRQYSVLLVRVEPELTDAAFSNLKDDVTRTIEHSGRAVASITDMTPTAHPNSGYVSAVSGLLALLGFLSVSLSGFLVFNAMAALFAQQNQYIGIMKAIGAQKKDIIRMYMAFIFVFGLLAMVIAIPASAHASAELGQFLAIRMNYNAGGVRYVPLAIVIQVIIALILPQAAGFIPILKASKVSVQEAITTTGIKAGDFGRTWFDRQVEKVKSIGRPLMISLRNTFRRKGRLILTLITLSLGGAVFIATFNVRASLADYIDQVANYMLADINIEFDRHYRISRVNQLILSVDGVVGVEPRGATSVQLLDDDGRPAESVEMLGAPPDSDLIEPILLRGRWIIPGDTNAIVLNEGFVVRYPELDVGDTITLRVNRRDIDWTVVGFFQFIGSDYFLAYVPLEHLNEVTGNLNRATNFQAIASPEIMAQGMEDDLAQRLDDVFRQRGFSVRNTTTSASIRDDATLGLDTLTIFLLIMSGLIALVGSISLTGTMSMNVLERTREIGLMRAIGATDQQVMQLVLVEGVIIGLISWVLGVVLAFPISTLMSSIINYSIFGVPGEFVFTVTGYAIWLGIVFLLSVIASLIPANNAARLTIREVLAYE